MTDTVDTIPGKRGFSHRDRRNRFGHVGVTPHRVNRGDGRPHFSWAGRCSKNYKNYVRTFSIIKYGYRGAYLMAIRFRHSITAEPMPVVDTFPEPDAELARFLHTYQITDYHHPTTGKPVDDWAAILDALTPEPSDLSARPVESVDPPAERAAGPLPTRFTQGIGR